MFTPGDDSLLSSRSKEEEVLFVPSKTYCRNSRVLKLTATFVTQFHIDSHFTKQIFAQFSVPTGNVYANVVAFMSCAMEF